MLYYSWYSGHGRAILADDLDAEDPFGLAPGAILGRVVEAGYVPAVDHPRAEPFRALGTVTEVECEGLVYLVAVSRDAEEISVQERRPRPDIYDLVE